LVQLKPVGKEVSYKCFGVFIGIGGRDVFLVEVLVEVLA
jgi:hypothetical protein